ERIRADTLVGMAFSNIIALAIILTAAATLHEAGVFSVETSAQAAEALRPIYPLKALYWTAVINGVVAVPVMTIMMLMTAQPRIMGKFTISGWLRWLGWAPTLAVGASAIGRIVGGVGAG